MDEGEVYQNEEDGEYISDYNPVTWDEDPNNYPLETPDTYENVNDEEVQSPHIIVKYQKVLAPFVEIALIHLVKIGVVPVVIMAVLLNG